MYSNCNLHCRPRHESWISMVPAHLQDGSCTPAGTADKKLGSCDRRSVSSAILPSPSLSSFWNVAAAHKPWRRVCFHILFSQCVYLGKCFPMFPGLCWLAPDIKWSFPIYYLDWLIVHYLLFICYWYFIVVLVVLLTFVNAIAHSFFKNSLLLTRH